MIITPLEKPVMTGLNSYYLDIVKLLEHFQGEFGTGAVHFKSPVMEGIIYFDEDDLVNSILQNGKELVKGREAADTLIKTAPSNNFNVAVYSIEPDKLYYWANIQQTEIIHENLSSEFTDLDGLLKKMRSEKLTGYIDIFPEGRKKSGLIFYLNGTIVGSTLTIHHETLNTAKRKIAYLLGEIAKSGGMFNVHKIVPEKSTADIAIKEKAEKQPQANPEEVMEMIQTLLNIFENSVLKSKKNKTEPDVLLRKKFIEKSDKYDFLDPFLADFEYTNGKARYQGEAPHELLLKGIIESIKELTDDLEIQIPARDLAHWKNKYTYAIKKYNITI